VQHFAKLAEEAHRADVNDVDRLGELINENFDTCRQLYRLPNWQIRMVEIYAYSASANLLRAEPL
jgi:hypothetical protein